MKRLLVAAGAVLALYAAYTLLPGNEEKVIRRTVRTHAARLSAPAGEDPLRRAARLASFRSAITPDIHVELAGEGLSLFGAEEVLGFAVRQPAPAGGLDVEAEGVEVTLQPDGQSADVRFTAMLLEPNREGRRSLLDGRPVALTLVRRDRAWLISSARIMPSDDAAGR